MTTFAALRSKIAVDLDRHMERLHGDEIGEAVLTAIDFYAHERFWFLEDDDTSITTVAGTPDYAKPTRLIEVDRAEITVSGNTYDLDLRHWDWYRDRAISLGQTRGLPTEYAIYNDRIWLYPTPSNAWSLTIWGGFLQPTLTLDADSNAWTVPPASELIRAHAKADILANRLGEADLAVAQMNVADLWLKRLRQRSVSETATGRVVPTCW